MTFLFLPNREATMFSSGVDDDKVVKDILSATNRSAKKKDVNEFQTIPVAPSEQLSAITATNDTALQSNIKALTTGSNQKLLKKGNPESLTLLLGVSKTSRDLNQISEVKTLGDVKNVSDTFIGNLRAIKDSINRLLGKDDVKDITKTVKGLGEALVSLSENDFTEDAIALWESLTDNDIKQRIINLFLRDIIVTGNYPVTHHIISAIGTNKVRTIVKDAAELIITFYRHSSLSPSLPVINTTLIALDPRLSATPVPQSVFLSVSKDFKRLVNTQTTDDLDTVALGVIVGARYTPEDFSDTWVRTWPNIYIIR